MYLSYSFNTGRSLKTIFLFSKVFHSEKEKLYLAREIIFENLNKDYSKKVFAKFEKNGLDFWFSLKYCIDEYSTVLSPN